MRKWALWCVNHRLSWVLYVVLVLILPLLLVLGAIIGAGEQWEDWRYEWHSLTKEINRLKEQNAATED